MTTVTQLLGKKGNTVYSVGPDETVFQALRKMADANVGCLLAMDGERLVKTGLRAPSAHPEAAGQLLAERLLEMGAGPLLLEES